MIAGTPPGDPVTCNGPAHRIDIPIGTRWSGGAPPDYRNQFGWSHITTVTTPGAVNLSSMDWRERMAWEQARHEMVRPVPHAQTKPLDFPTHDPRRMFASVRAWQDATVAERTLSRGTMRSTAQATYAGGSDNVNGRLRVVKLVDAHSSQRMKAIIKPISAGGAQERFAYEFAASIGAEHLLPRVGRRADGAAAIEFVPGTGLAASGIYNANQLERAFRRSVRRALPDIPQAEVNRRARVDRQLTQVLDYLLANGDRNGNNGLVDARTGRVTLIDHGHIGFSRTGLVTKMNMTYQGGVGTTRTCCHELATRVGPEVRALLAKSDLPRIDRAWRQLLRDTNGVANIGKHAPRPTQEFFSQVIARLEHVVQSGVIHVR